METRRRIAICVFLAVAMTPLLASAQGPGPSLRLGAKPDGKNQLDVRVVAGAGMTDEAQTASDMAGGAGLGLTYRPLSRMLLDARFGWARYSQGYLSTNAQPDGSRGVTVEESRWDGALAMGYDLLPPSVLGGKLAVAPDVGLHMFWLDNSSFGSWSGAPQIGLQAAVQATDRLSAQAGFNFGYVLFGKQGAPSVMGDSKAIWDYHAGFALAFGKRYRLDLAYVGETLVFERTYRYSNGAALALEIQTL